jgi:2-keto-4-pentenoate hydratase
MTEERTPVTDAAAFAADIAGRHTRRERYTLDMPDGRAGDLAFGYGTQEALLPLIGGEVVGWKIGLTTARMQQMCGVAEPIVGAILSRRVHASPARAAAGEHVRLGLESEMALRIGADFPADGEVAPGDVLACVDGICAAFELIEDWGADYARLSAATLVADNAWNAGLVTGPVHSAQAFGALAGRRGVLHLDGEAQDEGSSSDVLGDPAIALAWVARHLAQRGRPLRPGQWVSTGSIVPTRFAEPGQSWRFDLEGLEPVELMVT